MAINDTIAVLSKIDACKTGIDMAAYNVEVNKDVFPLYMGSIETLVSLAIAALILSVSFREKVLGQHGAIGLGKFLFSSWLAFLLSILSGVSYFFVAAKHTEYRYLCTSFSDQWWGITPGHIYSVCAGAFVLGAVLLVASVSKQVLHNEAYYK